MCKYCNHLTDPYDDRTAGVIIGGGIGIGNAKNILYVTTSISKNKKGVPCIRTDVYPNANSGYVMEKEMKIKYCPICGQKL